MGIAITLRDSVPINRFRDLLIGSIESGAGDNALLCSGFFQESRRSSYQASREKDFGRAVASSGIELKTVGVHNYGWKKSYKEFCNNMRGAGANVISYRTSGLKWHAKVFILSSGETPVFGIIGSSNITRPAFSTTSPFNYESDVFLWSDKNPKIVAWADKEMEEINDFGSIIRAPYLTDLNGGIKLEERLSNIKKKILSTGLLLLEQ